MRGRKSIWMHDPNFSDEEDNQDEDSHWYPTDQLDEPEDETQKS